MSDNNLQLNQLGSDYKLTTISRTHKYSCLLDSFAFVTGITPKELMRDIGHAGTGENEPRGFHTQEIIEPLINRGFWITPIELFPVSEDPETGEKRIVKFGLEEVDNFRRFAKQLQGANGVLLGFTQERIPHATAWVHSLVHDPIGVAYPILELNNHVAVSILMDKPLIPNMFWMIQ